MNAIVLGLLGLLGTGSVFSIVITKIFDLKLQKIQTNREIEITKITTEATAINSRGDSVETIVELNHILVAELARVRLELKECNDKQHTS